MSVLTRADLKVLRWGDSDETSQFLDDVFVGPSTMIEWDMVRERSYTNVAGRCLFGEKRLIITDYGIPATCQESFAELRSCPPFGGLQGGRTRPNKQSRCSRLNCHCRIAAAEGSLFRMTREMSPPFPILSLQPCRPRGCAATVALRKNAEINSFWAV